MSNPGVRDMLLPVAFNRRALNNRESCTLWYDGRR